MDAGGKLADYFGVPSVMHYLIVRPLRREVIHHARRGGGDCDAGGDQRKD